MKGTKKSRKNYWGFDMEAIDRSVKPQDNFFKYANGGWIKKATIPADEARWGSFNILRVETEKKLKHVMDKLLKGGRYAKGSPEQLVSDYYRSAFDMKRRNTLGIQVLHQFRQKIEAISNQTQLLNTIAYLHKSGVSGGWATFVDQDSKNSTKYILHLWQGGLGMPERDYYLKNDPEQKRVRDAYIVHIEKLLKIARFKQASIEPAREVVMKIETRLAHASMKKEDARDPEKVYHKVTPSPLWKRYLRLIGAPSARTVIVGQPKFFKEVEHMLKDIPLDEWKVYLKWHLINDFAGSLSQPFVQESFNFYSRVLQGTKEMKPLWRRALSSTNGALGEPLGKLYVKEYFPESAKKKIDILVSNLFEVYEERMKNLDWMSAGTKKKAILKLRAITRKIGYPKKWDLYRGVVIRPDDYFGNIMRVHAHDYAKTMRKLKRGVDRTEWFMSPQTVNAYCSQTLNDIVFPAAILQWPFFDPNADDAINYAGIGSVIGHEMTHAFDDNGAKFDIHGNMKNWWNAKDKKLFEKKSKIIVAQANKHNIAPGINLNGQLTLGENIADLGGLVIAYDAYHKHLQSHGARIIDGLTPDVRFFLGFAQTEREIVRPESLKMRTLTDPHAAAEFRINGPLSNFDPFYDTFGLTKKHKLFIERTKRARIW